LIRQIALDVAPGKAMTVTGMWRAPGQHHRAVRGVTEAVAERGCSTPFDRKRIPCETVRGHIRQVNPDFSPLRAPRARRKRTSDAGKELSATSQRGSSDNLPSGLHGSSISFALFAIVAVGDPNRFGLLFAEFVVRNPH
jgi:hypothetical protein